MICVQCSCACPGPVFRQTYTHTFSFIISLCDIGHVMSIGIDMHTYITHTQHAHVHMHMRMCMCIRVHVHVHVHVHVTRA